jgi:hypothetical protein
MANGEKLNHRPPRFMGRLPNRLAQADMVFYMLPFIMAFLVAGTLAQRNMGLFAAQNMFFGSFILWIGPIPLPGFYTFTALLTLSLLLKFLLASEWTKRKAGINLTHLGVLVILIGGLATSVMAREGYMMIAEGASSPYVYDYTQRDLFIFENDHLLRTIPFEELKAGNMFDLPFKITIKDRCVNCAIGKREDEGNFQGMAQFMALSDKPPSKEPEENIPGITFDISGTDKSDGTYIAFEAMPKPIELRVNKRGYKIIFGREQRLLPFSVKLQEFTKETYPGLDKAKAYISDIVITDGKLEWPARIEMNQPLRYKGYTLYQSSFEQGPQGELSVLSVVENKGRLFPYIGTGLIAVGLLLHLLLMKERRQP